MAEVTAIILAAGASRRMGARNKLLLSIGAVPMIRHMVDIYSAVATRPVLVVTGHEADHVQAALAGSGAIAVFNPDHAQGQPTSVACGLRAAGLDPDDSPDHRILIGLGDQPLLTADDLRALLNAHASADTARISIPAMDQRRGNPIVIPQGLRRRLLADPRSPGCKTFTRAHPEHVQFHALDAPGYYTDIDTPEAYATLSASPSDHRL